MPDAVGAESVAQQVPPVAEQPPAPVIEDPAALRAKLELLQQDNARKGESNRQLNERLGQSESALRKLQDELQSGKQAKLAESGEFRTLWEEAQAANATLREENAALQKQIDSVTQSVQEERLRTAALAQVADAGALKPQQLLGLLTLEHKLRESGDGRPVVVVNGIEQPLNTFLSNLRNPNSGYEHHFSPSGARGMGAAPSSGYAPGAVNPYKTGNLTEAIRLEMENPELAAALKREAGLG